MSQISFILDQLSIFFFLVYTLSILIIEKITFYPIGIILSLLVIWWVFFMLFVFIHYILMYLFKYLYYFFTILNLSFITSLKTLCLLLSIVFDWAYFSGEYRLVFFTKAILSAILLLVFLLFT